MVQRGVKKNSNLIARPVSGILGTQYQNESGTVILVMLQSSSRRRLEIAPSDFSDGPNTELSRV